MHEHSPGVAQAPKLFTIQALFEALILDGGYVSDYLYVRLVNMQIWWVDVCVNMRIMYACDSQDLLHAGETKDSTGRATMLVTVLLGTHHMHH